MASPNQKYENLNGLSHTVAYMTLHSEFGHGRNKTAAATLSFPGSRITSRPVLTPLNEARNEKYKVADQKPEVLR